MKVSRDMLKSMIKECLVEILSEGLGDQVERISEASRRQPSKLSVRPTQQARPAPPPRVNPTLTSAVKEVAGGNSVMEKILADTANTTLQEQMNADRPNRMLASVQDVPTNDDVGSSGMIDEAVDSHWADLAFNAPKADGVKLSMMGFKPQ